jgi:hypothetical protein
VRRSAVAGKAPAAGSQPSRDDLNAAVKKLNESMPPSAQSLEFSIDEDSKDIVVKVIDQSTKEVVRQIPSKRRSRSPNRSTRCAAADRPDRLSLPMYLTRPLPPQGASGLFFLLSQAARPF